MSIKGFIADLLTKRPGQKFSFILAFLSVTLYTQLAFFTARTETSLLIGSYTLLFAMYLMLTRSILSFNYLIGFGVVFRLIFIFSIPTLSDDFYRFYWDGVLINNQINPFLYLPREIIENPLINIYGLDTDLLNLLNSPDYHTIYPPVCQFVFFVSAKFANGNIQVAVLIMKSFLFLAEMGSIFLLIKLLKIQHLKKEYIFYYALNPLVIIELTGNIHFDGFLILFVLLSIYLMEKNRLFPAAIAFALAIASKLTPLILLPFFIKRMKMQRLWVFYGFTILFAVLMFWPFMGNALFIGLSSSISLYFQKFEFNASIFYIVREIGFWVKGWDIIQAAGVWMAFISTILMLIMALFGNVKKQNLPGIFIWPFFIYFAFASIVHPWYLCPIIAFSVFSKYRFPLLWSFTAFLSYAAYSISGVQEQMWVLFLEYVPVFSFMVYELWKHKDLIVFKNPLPDIFYPKT